MRRFAILGFVLFAFLARATSVSAQFGAGEEGMAFDAYFRLLAEEIRFFLAAEGKGAKSVGVEFSGPPTWKGSGSNRLVEELKAELALHKIKVESPASYAFQGRYKQSKSGRLHITGTLVDKFGETPAKWIAFPACLDPDPKLLATVMGLSADLMPRAGLNVEKQVKQAFENPSVAVTQNITARPSENSPFGVRVRVGKQPKTLAIKAGLAYATLDLDDTFELEVVNDSGYEIAAAISVDGLSIFHFSENRKAKKEAEPFKDPFDKTPAPPAPPRNLTEPRHRYYVFSPRSSGLVQGWEKNDTTVRAFKIVPFEECAAVQSGQATDVGMITVSFHASWEKGRTSPPRDEDRESHDDAVGVTAYSKRAEKQPDGTIKYKWHPLPFSMQGTKIGTGFGQDLLVSSQGVQREIGATRGLVTIRYDRKK